MKKLKTLFIGTLFPIFCLGQNYPNPSSSLSYGSNKFSMGCERYDTNKNGVTLYQLQLPHLDTSKIKILIFSNKEYEEAYTIYGYRVTLSWWNCQYYNRSFNKINENLIISYIKYNWK